MNTSPKTEWFDDDTIWRALTPLMFQVSIRRYVTKGKNRDHLDSASLSGRRYSYPQLCPFARGYGKRFVH
jgi:hypothetical protein